MRSTVGQQSGKPSKLSAVKRESRLEGFWLAAPLKVLLSRLAQRHGDPSDANATVLLAQASRDCGDVTWHRIDAESGAPAHRETMLAALAVWTRDRAQTCQVGARQQR